MSTIAQTIPNSKKSKIAICGKMGSGKTFLADELVARGYVKCSFACRVKELATELFGMKEKDRSLLIRLGAAMRSIDEDVWINTCLRNVEKYEFVVIDDLRMTNEYERLVKENWFTIKVEVDDQERNRRLVQAYGEEKAQNHMKHASSNTENEACLLPDEMFDMVIRNQNGSLVDIILKQ